jgi:hypothetical protein
VDTHKGSDPSEGVDEQDLSRPSDSESQFPTMMDRIGRSCAPEGPNYQDTLQSIGLELSTTIIDAQTKSEQPDPSEDGDEQSSLPTTVFKLSLPIRTTSEQNTQNVFLTSGLQNNPSEDTENGNKKVTTEVTRYNTRRLGSKTWECYTCNRDATEIIYITSSKGPELGVLEPEVSDMLIPVCTKEPCVTRGNALVEKYWTSGVPDSATTSCEDCQNNSRLKLCDVCRCVSK